MQEGGPASCALITQYGKQKAASEQRRHHLQQRMVSNLTAVTGRRAHQLCLISIVGSHRPGLVCRRALIVTAVKSICVCVWLCLPLCLQEMLSFSVDELSKLEQLLHELQLPADEASELQAGVINRLMDVYYQLNLQAAHPEVREVGEGEERERERSSAVLCAPHAGGRREQQQQRQ